jgi:hypothetical protein
MRRALAIALSTAFLVSGLVTTTSAIAVASSKTVIATPDPTGYDRTLFPLWTDADGDGCNTREELLKSQSAVPVTYSSGCTVATGQWTSWYDGATWTAASDVDIDHLVPLAEAWASGASAWTTAQRQAYANDLDYAGALQVITDNVNDSKGDQDPAEWMPALPSVACRYDIDWITVKYKWSLTMDQAEHDAIASTLTNDGCAGDSVSLPTVEVAASTTASSAPVYRFWSASLGAHFYTIDPVEKAFIQTNWAASWSYEGVAYQAFPTEAAGTVPLYRFWSSVFGDHFYTTSASERDHIVATFAPATWSYEGVAYYVYPVDSTVADTVTVARFWSPTLSTHFYTADATERDDVIARYPSNVWTFEGSEFRVTTPTAEPPVVVPPVVVPPVTPGQPGNPGDTKNCSDFTTYAQAYAWYITYFPYYGDVAKLDADHDGIPCETLPGHP